MKRDTVITLFSKELGRSDDFEVAHATALLMMLQGQENPTWELPAGSKYIFENGSINLRADTGKTKTNAQK